LIPIGSERIWLRLYVSMGFYLHFYIALSIQEFRWDKDWVSQNEESYPAMIWECPQTKRTRSDLYYYIYLGGEQTN
jgi:hypothetical protein